MRTILSLLIFILLASCSDFPDKINSPSWDVDLNIPITEKHYTLKDIVKLSEEIEIDSSSGMALYKVKSQEYSKSFTLKEAIQNKLDGNISKHNLPIASFDTTEFISFANNVEIDSAFISKCDFKFNIKNSSSEKVQIILTIPNAVFQSGSIFNIVIDMAPNSSYSETISHNNFSYSGRKLTNKNQLALKIKVTAAPSQQTLDFSLNILNSEFRYFEGKINPTEISPSVPVFALDISKDMELLRNNFLLNDVELNINASYISQFTNHFDGELNKVRVIGKRKTGETFFLRDEKGSEYFNDMYIGSGDSQFNKSFNNSNSNIVDFLSFLPDEIALESKVILNPGQIRGIASNQDSINLKIQFEATSNLRIDTVESIDTLDFEVTDSYRDEIRKGKFARLFYEISNAMPINNDLHITFANANFDTLFSKQFSFLGAVQNTPNSNAFIYTKDSTDFDSTQINLLSESRYIILKWKLFTPPNAPFSYFGPNQWVTFKTYANLKYRMELED